MAGLYRLFETPSGRKFVFDGATGLILTPKPGIDPEKLQNAQKALPSVEWEHSFAEYMELAERRIPALLLQLTRRCSLDCAYCVYSGRYAHMEPHAAQDMSRETLRRSLEFYRTHSADCPEASVDLYGGEALLRPDLAAEALELSGRLFAGKKLKVRLTTNGTLLGESAARLLERYPYFSVLVTVNGPEHDRYRRYPDGSGSLGRIMENLKRLRESRPEVWERQVHFIANVAGSDELPGLLDFYRRELGRPPDAVTHIRAQDADESVLDMLRPDDEALMERLRLEYCESGDPFLGAVFARQVQAVERRRLLRCGSCGIIGSCLPPSEKLFVHADGRFGVCETCCDKVIIGDLEHGFDREELHRLYCGAQRLFGAQCRGCWAQRLCTVCLKDVFRPDGGFVERISEGFCRESRAMAESQLRLYCELALRGAFDKGTVRR